LKIKVLLVCLAALTILACSYRSKGPRVPAPRPGIDGVIVKSSAGIHVFHRRHKTTKWPGMVFKDVVK